MDEIKEEREGEISTKTQGNKERKTDLLSPWESPEEHSKEDTVGASNNV